MDAKKPQPPQGVVLLRILGGGYLVYLAYDILRSGTRTPLIMIAAIVFLIAGGSLIFFSARGLMRNEYFYDHPEEESDPAELPEETEQEES